MRGLLGHLCCRHRPGEWGGERGLPRRATVWNWRQSRAAGILN